jgi:hypothetical protein
MGKTWGDTGKRSVIVTKVIEPEPTPIITIQDSQDIDTLMNRGLASISRMMGVISQQATLGTFDRETVQNLKDLMSMLGDLKKREAELLDSLSDDQLNKLGDV